MTTNPDSPSFTGYVETTLNALRLIHAARQSVIPRITRRLNDAERRTMIKSGAVFVFSVDESGIKRWTDGLLWSPSRIVGNFLVYREINERTSSRGSQKKPYPCDDSPTRALIRKTSPDHVSVVPMGFKGHAGNDQGTFKAGGLIKKTITISYEDSDVHLVSYYTLEDIRSGRLKRPSTRPDIMNLNMPVELFRLTNCRVPPKTERGPDGKLKLIEGEDAETVDCKVEDHGYNIPSSPTWSSPNSPTSPVAVDSPFNGTSLYSIGSSPGSGNSNGYARGNTNERWSGHTDSLLSPLQRQDMAWSQNTSSISSGHTMNRRRDANVVQTEGWPAVHSPPSGRWHGQHGQHGDSTPSSSSNNNVLYQDRSRIRSVHTYEESQLVNRRDNEGIQNHFTQRYNPHPNGTREGALQRLHWQTRDLSDHTRDPRRSTQQTGSYSPSPTLPFTPQYHNSTPTYTSSWTSESNLLTTPTLHSISNQPNMSYDGTYASSASMSSPEDYANPSVEEFRET